MTPTDLASSLTRTRPPRERGEGRSIPSRLPLENHFNRAESARDGRISAAC